MTFFNVFVTINAAEVIRVFTAYRVETAFMFFLYLKMFRERRKN